MSENKEFHILNLGAGVQSTALYLLDMDGELFDEFGFRFTHAIFADTQEEPNSVYDHLTWLEQQGGIPILKNSVGNLGDDVLKGVNTSGNPFVTIPAFTQDRSGGPVGQVRRQCTFEYKVRVVEKTIRKDILGLQPRQRIPKDVTFTQYMGFSFDEPGRAARAKGRFQQRGWKIGFPLFDMQWKRYDCAAYLEKRAPHFVPRSACVFCPYKSDREWLDLKDNDSAGWSRAVEIDEGMRKEGVAKDRRGNDSQLFLHRSCKPLAEADLGANQGEFDFMAECEGGCGL